MFHLQKSQSVNKGFVKYSFVIVYVNVLRVTICIYKYYLLTYCLQNMSIFRDMYKLKEHIKL